MISGGKHTLDITDGAIRHRGSRGYWTDRGNGRDLFYLFYGSSVLKLTKRKAPTSGLAPGYWLPD